MERAALAAAAYNKFANQGGRSTMDQHLSDVQREQQLQTLLGRSRQRGFLSPQQDYAFRQQEIQQRLLYNRAEQQGYASPDQYLGYVQRQRADLSALNSEWARRAQVVRSSTDAQVAHTNALSGTNLSAEQISSAYKGVQQQISQLPSDTKLRIGADDTPLQQAIARSVAGIDHLPAEAEKNKPKLGVDTRELDQGVADVRTRIRNLVAEIARNRLSPRMDTSGLVVRAESIHQDIGGLSRQYSGSGLQPAGLDKLKASLTDAQAYAARTFDDIEQHGARSESGISSRFTALKNTVRDTFTAMKVAAQDAGDSSANIFERTAQRIAAAFSGGAGGGSGWSGMASAFGDFGQTVAAMGQSIPAGVALISAAVLAVIQLLPPLVAGLGAVGSVAATLPSFLFAAGGAFGVFLSAVLPVIEALGKYSALISAQEQAQGGGLQAVMQQQQAYHALSDAQFSLTQAVVQGSNQQLTAAHSVADAEFALSQARFQAAQTAIMDAHNVSEAQYSLKQAYFSASMTQAQSAMQVASAYHSLQDAQFSVTQSQFQLNQAWVQARRSMQDLEIQVADASLNLRGAQLNLEQAQQNYAQVMAQSTSTALQRAQAAYQIQEAELALRQVELQNKRNSQDLATARKDGIKQYFGVAQAIHALRDAQFSEIEAQKQVILVQRQAANAQITAAHQISDAVFALQQAFTSQGEGALLSAHNVSDAMFSLQQAQFSQGQAVVQSRHQITDAQFAANQAMEQLKLNAQAGGAAAVSAYTAFQTALGELGPAGQRAVKLLAPLLNWWSDWHGAQNRFFRPFDVALAQAGPGMVRLIKPIESLLNATASALGNVAAKSLDWFLKMANSPIWSLFTRTSVSILTDLGKAGLDFAKAMTSLAIAAAPLATWIAKGILNWADSFASWANGQVKPGSMLHVLLNEARPALEALGHLLKSIALFFGILAGATPVFSKQGVLTGIVPSDSQNSAFHSFILLLGALSDTILPNLALVLNKLSNPQMQAAVISLLTALSTLLLNVVSSPGFVAAFVAFTNAFSALVLGFSSLAGNSAVGNVLGIIAGAFVAMSVLKFTGILALLANMGKVVGWVKGIGTAEGFFGKLASVFGKGTGVEASASTAASTLAAGGTRAGEALVASASEAANILAAGGAKAGASEAAGGVAAGAEGAAAGGTAGGVAARAEGAAGGLLSRGALGSLVTDVVLPVVISAFAANWVLNKLLGQHEGWLQRLGSTLNPNNLPGHPVSQIEKAFPGSWADPARWEQTGKDFNKWVVQPVSHFFSSSLPGFFGGITGPWSQSWAQNSLWFSAHVVAPVRNFFTQTIPGWLDGLNNVWAQSWVQDWQWFFAHVVQPIRNFFTQTIPGWLDGLNNAWTQSWTQDWHWFDSRIIQPVGNFFTQTIPGWFGSVSHEWGRLWNSAWGFFSDNVAGPAARFFTNRIPSMFDDVAGWFHSKVAAPLGRFFTRSLPGTIENAFKSSVDWVIRNVINRVIVWINDATHVVGLPKISTVQQLADGGHVFRRMSGAGSVAGSGDGDSVPIMATPGEFMIRKAARMAIDRKMGPDFLPGVVNQADKVLGYAAGGGIGGFLDNVLHSAEGLGSDIWSGVSGLFSGAGSALGKLKDLVLSDGAVPVINAMFSHLVTPLEHSFGINSQTERQPVPHLVAYLTDSLKKNIDSSLTGVGGPLGGLGGLGPTPLPGGGNASANAALARRMMPAWASGSAWAAWNDLEMREAGWNQFAMNPSSGAYGIPQALPLTKMPKAAWPASMGGRSDPGAQISWMASYILGRYGSVQAADAHEQSAHWYKMGGPIGLAGGGPVPTNQHGPVLTISQRFLKGLRNLSGEMTEAKHALGTLRGRNPVKFRREHPSTARRFRHALEQVWDDQRNMDMDWRHLGGGKSSPASWTAAEWNALRESSKDISQDLDRPVLRKWAPEDSLRAHRAMATVRRLEDNAWFLWKDLYSPGKPDTFRSHPGPGAPPPPEEVPSPPGFALPTGPQAYYASGGGIPDWFPGLGMPSAPLPAAPGIPARAVAQESSRTLSEGASAVQGQRAGSAFHVENMVINNPVPERAGDSMTRQVNRQRFLAGRGIV